MNRLSRVTKRTSENFHSSGNYSSILTIVFVNILSILIFYRSNLLGQETIPYDIQWYQFPHYSYLFQHLKEFAIPIWDPYTYGGGPYFANSQNQLFYLPNFVYSLLNSLLFAESTIRQLQFFQIINHYIFILGLSVLSYNIKKNTLIAISISTICGFSGIFISDLQHVGQINSITWTPWLLLSLQKVKENKSSLKWKCTFTFSLLFICTGGFIIALLPIITVILIYGFDKIKDFMQILIEQRYSLLFVASATFLSLLYPFLWREENFGQSTLNFDFDLTDTVTVLFPNNYNSFNITQYTGTIDITKGYNFVGPILIFLAVSFFRLDKLKKTKVGISLVICTSLFSNYFVQSLSNSQTLSIFRPIEFRILILFTIFYALNWSVSAGIKHKWFVLLGLLTALYSVSLVVNFNKFNNIIVVFSTLLCLIYFTNVFSGDKKILTVYLLSAIFIFIFHTFIPNQIWKAKGSGNYFNETYMRGGNAKELLNTRNVVGQNSRVATSSFNFGGDFWNGWRVWEIRSINGWEPHINGGFGGFAQSESSQKNNRYFGDFALNSEFLKAFAVNEYITNDTDSISTDWNIFQQDSFAIAKRKDIIDPVNFINCGKSDDVKFKYNIDKFSMPKYEIELNENSALCNLQISEIYRQGWIIENSSNKKLEIELGQYNTILIRNIDGVARLNLSIEKSKYLVVFSLYYFIIVLQILIFTIRRKDKIL